MEFPLFFFCIFTLLGLGAERHWSVFLMSSIRDMKYSQKLPSLLGYILWKYGFKQWADNGEIKKFPNSRPHKPFKTNQLITYETGDSPAATLSYWGQVSSCKQSECWMHSPSNILELIATFLYSFITKGPFIIINDFLSKLFWPTHPPQI